MFCERAYFVIYFFVKICQIFVHMNDNPEEINQFNVIKTVIFFDRLLSRRYIVRNYLISRTAIYAVEFCRFYCSKILVWS